MNAHDVLREEKKKQQVRVVSEQELEKLEATPLTTESLFGEFQPIVSVVLEFPDGSERLVKVRRFNAEAFTGISGLLSWKWCSGGRTSQRCAVAFAWGLGLAYGASRLINRSPSAEVYQRSQYGSVDGSEERTNRNVSPNPGTTRASQESGAPTLEANLNVTVEASGTRLAQANARTLVKTERWVG